MKGCDKADFCFYYFRIRSLESIFLFHRKERHSHDIENSMTIASKLKRLERNDHYEEIFQEYNN